MGVCVAILDACVLYPAPLRDLLMRLAAGGVYHARWTEQIHDEWVRNVLRDRPDIDEAKLLRVRRLMNEHAVGCVVTGYEALIEEITLPDPDDRHVLAAARFSGAGTIVTFNLKDFPDHTLSKFAINAEHPDEFVHRLIDLDEEGVIEAVRSQRAALRNPPISAETLLNTLKLQGMPKTVDWLRERIDEL